jgi:hypothetical protein
MRDIYASAEMVISWVGSDDENIPVAFETLEMLYRGFKVADSESSRKPRAEDKTRYDLG